MIEKPKRPKKIPNQDNKQPQTIQELIRRYDLDNTKIYDFLDELVESLRETQTVVSTTEPTGDNREKVWMQKGKNLFDKSNSTTNAWIGEQGKLAFFENSNIVTGLISCKPNTTYTVSGYPVNVFTKVVAYNSNGTYTQVLLDIQSSVTQQAFTTGNDDYYIRVGYGDGATTINTLQLEQGSTATNYEPYIEPKIHVKNDNDVYEEFVNIKDIPSEVKRYDITLDCGLVLHFFKYGKVVNCIAEGTISSLSANTDQACNIPKEFAPLYVFRDAVVIEEGGILGYLNINTGGYVLIRAKTAISGNIFPRFSFTYITEN